MARSCEITPRPQKLIPGPQSKPRALHHRSDPSEDLVDKGFGNQRSVGHIRSVERESKQRVFGDFGKSRVNPVLICSELSHVEVERQDGDHLLDQG